MSKPSAVRILGTPIAVVDEMSFLGAVEVWLSQRKALTDGVFVCFRDVHGVIRAKVDRDLSLAHEKSLMNVPDGMPLVWLTRYRSSGSVQRVCGPDMLPLICNAGLSKRWRHVFFGSSPAVLKSLTSSMMARFPDLIIADSISPPFGPLGAEEEEKLLTRVRVAKPDIVWIGLGSPKQELWMLRNAHTIPGAISMGVGAAFDFHAGTVNRAPVWLQRTSMEWVYRVVQEPRRLGSRYLLVVPWFLFSVAVEEARLLYRRYRGNDAGAGDTTKGA